MKYTARSIFAILFTAVLIGLMVMPVAVGHAAPMYAPTNPGTTSLIAWWALDETSGTRYDAHGTNHLTDNNTVGYGSGIKSNAANFAASNLEYLSIADNINLSMGVGARITLCTWVNLNTKTANLDLSRKSGTTYEYIFRYSSAADRFAFFVSSNGSTLTTVSADVFGPVSTGAWNYVCAGYDGAQTWISVNGGGRDTHSFTSDIYDYSSIFTLSSTVYMNGYLDEFAFYKRSLTTDEVSWLYNSGSGRSYCEVTDTCVLPTPTSTVTFTPTNTFTFTPTNTSTFTPTNTATFTITPSHTSTVTDTPTDTPTETPTESPTPTETSTPTISPTPSRTPTPTSTPANMMTAFWQNSISYGDAAQVSVTSLLCLVVVIGLLAWLVITTLQRKRK